MNEEFVKLVRAMIGGIVVAADSDVIEKGFGLFLLSISMKLDEILKLETGEHVTPSEYVTYGKDAYVDYVINETGLSEAEQKGFKLLVEATEKITNELKASMSKVLDEVLDPEKDEQDISLFTDFINSLEDKDFSDDDEMEQ